jgi:hypothetical protein
MGLFGSKKTQPDPFQAAVNRHRTKASASKHLRVRQADLAHQRDLEFASWATPGGHHPRYGHTCETPGIGFYSGENLAAYSRSEEQETMGLGYLVPDSEHGPHAARPDVLVPGFHPALGSMDLHAGIGGEAGSGSAAGRMAWIDQDLESTSMPWDPNGRYSGQEEDPFGSGYIDGMFPADYGALRSDHIHFPMCSHGLHPQIYPDRREPACTSWHDPLARSRDYPPYPSSLADSLCSWRFPLNRQSTAHSSPAMTATTYDMGPGSLGSYERLRPDHLRMRDSQTGHSSGYP